tara:strand:- start:12 stop:158 length:147 start_codon:yes stop_codon:yes gene_type:complete
MLSKNEKMKSTCMYLKEDNVPPHVATKIKRTMKKNHYVGKNSNIAIIY